MEGIAVYKKIKVYDLDGTLIDSSHRYRTANGKIDLPYWIENDTPEKVQQDKLLILSKWLYRDLERVDTYVIFATARACVENDATYQFLKDNNMWPDMFIHRQGRDDARGGAELKIEAIRPLLNQNRFKDATIHIFEDNIKYLENMTNELNSVFINDVIGHFIPSIQGH